MSAGGTLLVSPAEPAIIKTALAKAGVEWESSAIPEKLGVDFAWRAHGRWWGIQRKTVTDLIASMRDGRVTREVAQMTSEFDMPMLLIEGPVSFTIAGQLIGGGYGGEFTQSQWRGLMWSLASRGVTVDRAANPTETVRYIADFMAWSAKEKHTSLDTRPKNVDAKWGTPRSRDWGVFLLQGFDGVGAGVAAAMWDHFGGVPLRWAATREELLKVPGLGKVRVDRLLGMLPDDGHPGEPPPPSGGEVPGRRARR